MCFTFTRHKKWVSAIFKKNNLITSTVTTLSLMNAQTSDERNITLNPTYEGPLFIIVVIIIIIIMSASSRRIQIFRRAHKNGFNENRLHNTITRGCS